MAVAATRRESDRPEYLTADLTRSGVPRTAGTAPTRPVGRGEGRVRTSVSFGVWGTNAVVERVGTLIGTRVARQSSRPSRDSGFFIGQGSNRETGETPARIATSDDATRRFSALDRVASTYDAIWRRQWLRHGRLRRERGGFNRRDAEGRRLRCGTKRGFPTSAGTVPTGAGAGGRRVTHRRRERSRRGARWRRFYRQRRRLGRPS